MDGTAPTSSRKQWAACLLVLLGLLALVPVVSAEAAPPTGALTAAASQTPASLLSTAARQERLASRTAYRGRLGAAARKLAVDKFGGAVQGPVWKQPQLPTGIQAAGLTDDRVMRVTAAGQPAGLMTSTVPLRAKTASGDEAPTDLSLKATSGAFAPVNSPEPSTIGATVGDGVALPDVGVGLKPQVAVPKTQGVLSDDRVFYTDASADTDLIMGPTPSGAQVLYQLRSPASPGSFDLDVAIPDGALSQMASDGSGAVEIIRGGHTISRVEPPLATDAQGQTVPTRYELHGTRITIDVDHAAGDYAYPILVDPVVDYQDWNEWPSQGVNGWFYTTPWPDYFFPSTGGSWGNGLYSVMGLSRYYGASTYGDWRYPLYGTSYAYDVRFALQREQTNSPSQAVCATWGLVNGVSGWDNSQYWIGSGGNGGTGARTRCHTFDNVADRSYSDTCLQSDCLPPSSHQPNYPQFEQWVYGAGVRDGWNISYLGDANVYITDPEDPTITASAFNDVVAGSGESFSYTASDPGLGVKSVSFSSPGNPNLDRATPHAITCAGTSWDRCPATVSDTDGYGNLPPGDQTIVVTATDAAGRSSTPTSFVAHIYPTSVQYGGADRSVNTDDERLALYNAAAGLTDDAGTALFDGLSPTDGDAMDDYILARNEIVDDSDSSDDTVATPVPADQSDATSASVYTCYFDGEAVTYSSTGPTHRPYPPTLTGGNRDYVNGRADFHCDSNDVLKLVKLKTCLVVETFLNNGHIDYAKVGCETEEFVGRNLADYHGVPINRHCNGGYGKSGDRRHYAVRVHMTLFNASPYAWNKIKGPITRTSRSAYLNCVALG